MSKLPQEGVAPLLIAIVTSLDIFSELNHEKPTIFSPYDYPAILLELLSERRDAISLSAIVHIVQALVIQLPLIIESHSYKFASQLLFTTTCLFLQEPASFQHILGRVLSSCLMCNPEIESDSSHHVAVYTLHSQAVWYYRLLKTDPSADLAKKVFQSH